jgi:hypothetical protein
MLFFSCGNNSKSPKTNEESELNSTKDLAQEKNKTSKDAELISAGRELILHNYQKEDMKFLFKEVNIIKLADDSYNLVLKIQLKNDMSYNFLVSDSGWKLTDSNMIEVKESGVYNFDYNDFAPAMFFFVIVEPGFGKIEEVGYHLKQGIYYLHVGGMQAGKIIVQE